MFASVLLGVLGCFNLIYGIAAISHVFAVNAHYVVGSLRTWDWITLIIGARQLVASAGVVADNQPARWLAIAVRARADLGMVRLHDLRHSCASFLLARVRRRGP
jgi:integrase